MLKFAFLGVYGCITVLVLTCVAVQIDDPTPPERLPCVIQTYIRPLDRFPPDFETQARANGKGIISPMKNECMLLNSLLGLHFLLPSHFYSIWSEHLQCPSLRWTQTLLSAMISLVFPLTSYCIECTIWRPTTGIILDDSEGPSGIILGDKFRISSFWMVECSATLLAIEQRSVANFMECLCWRLTPSLEHDCIHNLVLNWDVQDTSE